MLVLSQSSCHGTKCHVTTCTHVHMYMYYKNICPLSLSLSLSKHTCTCIFSRQENVQVRRFQNDNVIHVHVS